MFRVILDLDADINAKDPLGMTAAFRAVTNRSSGILALLLDRGADIDARTNNGESLIHVAAKQWNRVDIMQSLLDRGADIHVLTEKGENLVHIAADSSTSSMLDYLIGNGASLDAANEKGVLMVAAKQDRLETLMALMKRGARLNTADSEGRSALHYAIAALPPKPDIVEVIVQEQTVNLIDIKGRTPLHYAHYESAQLSDSKLENWKTRAAHVTRLLIEGGASDTMIDEEGRIPKDYLDWSTEVHRHDWKREYRNLTICGRGFH